MNAKLPSLKVSRAKYERVAQPAPRGQSGAPETLNLPWCLSTCLSAMSWLIGSIKAQPHSGSPEHSSVLLSDVWAALAQEGELARGHRKCQLVASWTEVLSPWGATAVAVLCHWRNLRPESLTCPNGAAVGQTRCQQGCMVTACERGREAWPETRFPPHLSRRCLLLY